jgi:hypothetical protein
MSFSSAEIFAAERNLKSRRKSPIQQLRLIAHSGNPHCGCLAKFTGKALL